MNKVTQNLYHTSIAVGNEVTAYTAVSNFNTVGVDFSKYDAPWTLQISRSASDGSPTVTIQCCDDNASWKNYKDESTNIDVTTGEIFIDDDFKPRYLRVSYTANSATGTITMKLTTQQ